MILGEKTETNAQKRSRRMAASRKKGTHTRVEWVSLREFFDCCVKCGTTEFNLEKDHIMPVYQGGSDGIENIQPLCARCNSGKGPENIDHRSESRLGWLQQFEKIIGRKLLVDGNMSVCLNGGG